MIAAEAKGTRAKAKDRVEANIASDSVIVDFKERQRLCGSERVAQTKLTKGKKERRESRRKNKRIRSEGEGGNLEKDS